MWKVWLAGAFGGPSPGHPMDRNGASGLREARGPESPIPEGRWAPPPRGCRGEGGEAEEVSKVIPAIPVGSEGLGGAAFEAR